MHTWKRAYCRCNACDVNEAHKGLCQTCALCRCASFPGTNPHGHCCNSKVWSGSPFVFVSNGYLITSMNEYAPILHYVSALIAKPFTIILPANFLSWMSVEASFLKLENKECNPLPFASAFAINNSTGPPLAHTPKDQRHLKHHNTNITTGTVHECCGHSRRLMS